MPRPRLQRAATARQENIHLRTRISWPLFIKVLHQLLDEKCYGWIFVSERQIKDIIICWVVLSLASFSRQDTKLNFALARRPPLMVET